MAGPADAVCGVDELPDKAGRVVRVRGRTIALFRVGEEVFALDNNCPHYGGDLGAGIVSAKLMEVACPWHRMRFSLRTGICATYDRLGVATHPVSVRDGQVYVEIGG